MSIEEMKALASILAVLVMAINIFIIKPLITPLIEKFKAEKEKALADLSEQERQELRDCVEDAVQAVEKVFGSKAGEKKKEKVREMVTTKLNTLTHLELTPDELDSLIEAFVYCLDPK